MKNRRHRVFLGVLVLLAVTAPAWGQDLQQRKDHEGEFSLSLHTTENETTTVVDSLADWWASKKLIVQHLSACGLASASPSYALIVGIANPVGGAFIGLMGAGFMVAVCL